MSSYEFEEYPPPEFPPLGLVSIWFGVFLIGVTAAAHIFLDSPAQLWGHPLVSMLQLALIALIFGSLLYLLLRWSDTVKLAAVPLIINIGTFLIVRYVPFGSLWQEIRFQGNMNRYQEIVYLVESGQLQPDAAGYATLPLRYRSLTRDGDTIRIDVDGDVTRLFFYTRRASPQNFTGYYYRSDNNPPQPGEFDGRWRHMSQVRPYWFYCSSY